MRPHNAVHFSLLFVNNLDREKGQIGDPFWSQKRLKKKIHWSYFVLFLSYISFQSNQIHWSLLYLIHPPAHWCTVFTRVLTTYHHNHRGNRNDPALDTCKDISTLGSWLLCSNVRNKKHFFRQDPSGLVKLCSIQYLSLYLPILRIGAQNGKRKKHCPGPSYVACSPYLNCMGRCL